MIEYRIAVAYRTTNKTGVWNGYVKANDESAAIVEAHRIVRAKHGCKLFRVTDTQITLSGWNRPSA
jgi:hypothetical protein